MPSLGQGRCLACVCGLQGDASKAAAVAEAKKQANKDRARKQKQDELIAAGKLTE
jgi:hypothetical protein